MNYNLVILVRNKDVLECTRNYSMFFEYLPIKKVIYLGNGHGDVKSFPTNDKIEYFNGENLISYSEVENLLEARSKSAIPRTGWYLQQFLKLAYAYVCKDDYYIVWDSDSWPVTKINFFDNDEKPYFRTTNEYHRPYFDTLNKLFPKLEKIQEESFICAHMVFNVAYVKEMLKEIEANSLLSGNKFYEKIISAINLEILPYTGFSEFETYGTYVMYRHPNNYLSKPINIDRYVSRYFKIHNFDYESKAWMAKDYNIVCFEGWCKYNILLHAVMKNKYIHAHYSAKYMTEKILQYKRNSNEIKKKTKNILKPLYKNIRKHISKISG